MPCQIAPTRWDGDDLTLDTHWYVYNERIRFSLLVLGSRFIIDVDWKRIIGLMIPCAGEDFWIHKDKDILK
ncbi:hypothetical protein DL98DRAFT_519038 [Cadophora sp. DSE1049]|nr:hypothetical protein DL98DRAFT_519038 [Cadophora sp. DSE1049]